MSAAGILVLIRLPRAITPITYSDTTMVGMLARGRFARREITCPTGPPGRVAIPNMPPSCPMAIWIPTPVRNPMMTARERKSETNPSFSSPARRRNTAARMAIIPAYATYCGERGTAITASPLAMIAAVAESAPTTRCRDDPKMAKTAIGRRIV